MKHQGRGVIRLNDKTDHGGHVVSASSGTTVMGVVAALEDDVNAIQPDVLPELRAEVGVVTPTLARVAHVLELARVEEFASASGCGVRRPAHTGPGW